MKLFPFVRYAGALIGGILLYVSFSECWWLPIGMAIVGAGLFALNIVLKNRGNVLAGIGALLLLAALGWGITDQRTAATNPDNVSHLTDSLKAYTGVISAQPEERAKTFRVVLALQRGRTDQQSWQSLSGNVIVYLDKTGQTVPRYGEMWLVSGPPRPIDPPLNPGEFNYKRYLAFKGLYHQQYLRPWQRQVLDYAPANQLTEIATRVNRWADSVFTAQIGSRAEFAIVNAMLLGVRDDLDPELYRAYAAAGAVHILSVSGLHVGILFGCILFFLKRAKLDKHAQLRWPLAIFQLLILWFYALVTGLSAPVLRSAGMFTLVILARAMQRDQHLPGTLGASAFFILCLDPYALFSAGFQLSYLAVAGIGAWQSPLYQIVRIRWRVLDWGWNLTAVALVAQLITFPLGVFYFHQFPAYFLLANPVVMGLSLVLLPLAMATLALCWVPGLNTVLGFCLKLTASLLNTAVAGVGQLPGAIQEGLWLSPMGLVLTYAVILAGAALLLTRQRRYLWAMGGAAFGLAGLLLFDTYREAHQQRLAVHFLPHKTAISLTNGHQSTLLTDLDVKNDPRSFDFYLKSTFGQWGITDLAIASIRADSSQLMKAYHKTPDYALWIWQGKSILIVNKLSGKNRWRLPAVIDYLIIRRNALQDWDQLKSRVVARRILFDDSNKTPLTDRLLSEAKTRGIVCYSVRQMGMFSEEF